MLFSIETDRLLLRPFQASDNEAMFLMDSNPNVHRYLGNKPLTSREQCDEYIQYIQKQYKENNIGRFVVEIKTSKEIIGWAGLKFITESLNGHNNFYDIGYRLAEAHWGKGYANEAAKAWRDYAFNEMNIPMLFASAHIDNIASNKILQKIGMHQNGQYHYNDEKCNWYELNNPDQK